MPPELSSPCVIKPVTIKESTQTFLFRCNKQGRKRGEGLPLHGESQAQKHFEKEKRHKSEVFHWETEGGSFVQVSMSWLEQTPVCIGSSHVAGAGTVASTQPTFN